MKILFSVVTKADATALCEWWNNRLLKNSSGQHFTARHTYAKSKANPMYYDVLRDESSIMRW